MTKNVFNPYDYGADGNGITNDTNAVNNALAAAIDNEGVFYVPPGRFRVNGFRQDASVVSLGQLSIRGEGSNVSRILMNGANGLNLTFDQLGIHQPFGLNMSDIGFYPIGPCGTAFSMSYGDPEATSEHFGPSLVMRNVVFASNEHDLGYWSNGVDLTSVWNPTLTDVFISGTAARGVWGDMCGVGLKLNRMDVNAVLNNVKTNFWKTGIQAHGTNHNTEGIFATNCTMVGVHRGVWIAGNPEANPKAPRISTLTWVGGMIENRFSKGVKGGLAAFHFERVWNASIIGCAMLPDTINCLEPSYGVIAQDCNDVAVNGCGINAYHHGVLTTGECSAIVATGNMFTNTPSPVTFNQGCVNSRAAANVRNNGVIPDIVVDFGGETHVM